MNTLILFIETLVIFSLVIVAYKLFGKKGLIAWVGIASVIANIQVLKNVNILGLGATVGNVMFASNFLATDILTENHSEKDAKTAINLGLFFIIIHLISSQILLWYNPAEYDIAHDSMVTIFQLAPRITISSVLMYYLSNKLDIYIYRKLKKQPIWIKNNVSTIVSNSIENFGFSFLAFYGVYSIKEVLIIAVSTTVIEVLIAFLDTPFVYLSKRFKRPEEN